MISLLPKQITPEQIGLIHLISPTADATDSDIPAPSVYDDIARLFHRKYTAFMGTVHEQLVSKQNRKADFIPVPLTFRHKGYSTLMIKKEKAARNISLLEAELQNKGDDPYLLFQLGQSYFGLSDYEHALPFFEKALSMEVNEQETYVQTLVESYGYCLLYLKQYPQALALEGVYAAFSHHADFVFLMGLIYMNNSMFDSAVSEFMKATNIPHYSVEGVNGCKAYYNIGVIYECLGRKADAVKYYSLCGDYPPALKRLSVLK